MRAVIGLGIPQPPLAGRAGLVGAVRAHLGAVALVVGGDNEGNIRVLTSAVGTGTALWRAGSGGTGSGRGGISPIEGPNGWSWEPS